MVTQKPLDHSIQMIIDCLLLAQRTAVKAYSFYFSHLQNRTRASQGFLELTKESSSCKWGNKTLSPIA